MKKLMLLAVLVLCMAMLTGCFCKHETWNDANCETPKTCAECGETEGEALGHVWMAATCETPKTCEQCGKTEGEAKGHDWQDVTCETPITCSRCGLTEGSAMGHDWQDATTELPKTCATCALTEGERIITDARFTTASTIELQGKWGYTYPVTAEDLGVPELAEPLEFVLVMDFGNDGSFKTYTTVVDENAFWNVIIDIYVEAMYDEFAAQGLDRNAADQAMIDAYGMGIKEYLQKVVEEVSINEMIEDIMGYGVSQLVYYVENGTLYSAPSWEGTMEEDVFALDGDTLIIDSINAALGEEVVFNRITD